MAHSLVWQLLWVMAALVAGALMFGAWTGPHRSVSNLSRWVTWFGLRSLPAWLNARAADRWAFRGGLATLVLLLAAALAHSVRACTGDAGCRSGTDTGKTAVAPLPPPDNAAVPSTARPAYRCRAEERDLAACSEDEAGQARDPERRCRGQSICLGDRRVPQVRGLSGRVAPSFFHDGRGRQYAERNHDLSRRSDPNVLVIRIGLNDRT